MEDILREILYELKEIRKEVKGNNATVEIKIDDDVIAEEVIENINKSSRLSKHNLIRI